MSGKTAQVQQASYGRDQVEKIINSVIEKMQKSDPVPQDTIAQELLELKQVIDKAREDVRSANPDEIKGVHIPSATDELDAVVGATEEATDTIMDCCEVIQQSMSKMDKAVAGTVEEQITKIFEACSFQDISGQRITKVVRTLQTIEEKVTDILAALEGNGGRSVDSDAESAAVKAASRSEEDGLLNGPQLPGNAFTQADIDQLLAEFDD